jgi:hypothetical protein
MHVQGLRRQAWPTPPGPVQAQIVKDQARRSQRSESEVSTISGSEAGGGTAEPDKVRGSLGVYMGIFSRERRPSPAPPQAPQVRSIEVTLNEGSDPLEVVGESHHQEALWSIVGGYRTDHVRCEVLAILVAEHDNPYDSNAISIWVNGLHVGFLSRADAAAYRPGLLTLQHRYGHLVALRGAVVGGGQRADGIGQLGVFLTHDATDFGIANFDDQKTRGSVSAATNYDVDSDVALRTGRHMASRDLSCLGAVPDDDTGAVKFCRQLLAKEQSPLVRHFVYLQVEHHLYRCREVFSSALEEFDAACRAHDSEMEVIRPALFERFGGIPLLETYRQMCVRQQKLHDWTQVNWWAERGLAIYGEQALDGEWPADLRGRAVKAKEKLKPRPRARTASMHPPKTGAVVTEDLVCQSCHSTFTRVVMPGRKPSLCPTCLGETAPTQSAPEGGIPHPAL